MAVHEHEVGRLLLQLLEGLFTAVCGEHLDAKLAQAPASRSD